MYFKYNIQNKYFQVLSHYDIKLLEKLDQCLIHFNIGAIQVSTLYVSAHDMYPLFLMKQHVRIERGGGTGDRGSGPPWKITKLQGS